MKNSQNAIYKSFIKRKFTLNNVYDCPVNEFYLLLFTDLNGRCLQLGVGSCLQHFLPILWKSRTVLNNYVVDLKNHNRLVRGIWIYFNELKISSCDRWAIDTIRILTPGKHQSYNQQHKFICRNFSIWNIQLCKIITKHSSIYNIDYKKVGNEPTSQTKN